MKLKITKAMFTILHKRVGNRVFDRYYKDWDNAKHAFDVEEVEDFLESGYSIKNKIDRFNAAKGFYEYEVTLIKEDEEEVHLSLIDGFFMDEE
jgi:hypothetical protein